MVSRGGTVPPVERAGDLMKMERRVVIWGAGKIGRGGVAEIFFRGPFQMTFVDASGELTAPLRADARYSIVKAPAEGEIEVVEIDGFEVLHIEESEAIDARIHEASIVAVVLFPAVFESFADEIARGIELRALSVPWRPLDIIACANIGNAALRLRPMIRGKLSSAAQRYFDESIGIVGSVVMRVGVPTPPRFASYGPLTVTTNGFPGMPVDRRAFRGPVPPLPMLHPVDNIEARETRKFFTYNMVHAVYAYAGGMAGCRTVLEAASNPRIDAEVRGAFDEVSPALQAEFDFSAESMDEWKNQVFSNLINPLIEDSLERVGGEPIRKLGVNDRLIGPIRLCLKHGIRPLCLARTAACVLFFDSRDDAGARHLHNLIEEKGAAGALREITGLEADSEVCRLVIEQYKRLA